VRSSGPLAQVLVLVVIVIVAPFIGRLGSLPRCPHLVVHSPCLSLTRPPLSCCPVRSPFLGTVICSDGRGCWWWWTVPIPSLLSPLSCPCYLVVPIIIIHTPVVLISTHNPTYEQWLVGMGVGAGCSSSWRW
jgi:hypothetical protein